MPRGESVPLEKDIQKAILQWLRKRPGSFTVKLAAGPYSQPGLPDILHIEDGTAYFFEVKRPGGHLTKLQAEVLLKLDRAGAPAFVVRSVAEVKAILRACLMETEE